MKTTILRRLLLAVAALAMTVAAHAVDMTELQLDYEYEITGNIFRTYYYFTPTVGGTLSAYGPGVLHHYEDDAFETEITDVTNGYENGGKVSAMSVSAGETYYLMYYCMESSYSFYCSLLAADVKPEISYVSPAEGEVLYLTDEGDGMISWQFSRPVVYGAVTITGEKEGTVTAADTLTCRYTNGYYSVSATSSVMRWLQEGAIGEDDTITLTIDSIYAEADSTSYYGDDGTAHLSWRCCAKPAELVEEAWPATFLSYWESGDSAGKAVLTFDRALCSYDEGQTAQCTIAFGTREEEGGYYTETIAYAAEDSKISVDDKTLTIDLSGVSRTRNDMLPSFDASEFDTITLSVQLVKADDGTYAYTTIAGGLGSFTTTIPYAEVEESDGITAVPATTTVKRHYNAVGQSVNARTKGIIIEQRENGETKKLLRQ